LANFNEVVAKAALKKEDAVIRFVYGPNKCLVYHIVRFKRSTDAMNSQLRSHETIPSVTIQLFVKSHDDTSFPVMPGSKMEGFADLKDDNNILNCFLKATDVGSMCYALDEEEPAKIVRVFEGDTPGTGPKTEVVGTAKVVCGADVVAIGRSGAKKKKTTKKAAAAAPAPSLAAAENASTPAKAAAAATTTIAAQKKKKKKKEKADAKKKAAEASADKEKAKEDTAEKPPAKPKATGKKGKDPNAPKRSMNAYMFYSNANRAKMKEANKEVSPSDLVKMLAESWKKLSSNKKKRYEDMAADDKERYQKEMKAYSSKDDSADESADEPAKDPAEKAKATEKKSKAKTTKKVSKKKDDKEADASKASASSKKKDGPTAAAAVDKPGAKPKAKPKPMTQVAKKAQEKEEMDMLQAKFLKLPKKAQDAATSGTPVTCDRVHTLGPVGREIMRKALSEAGMLDGGNDDDDNSGKEKSSSITAAAAGTSTKKKRKKATEADAKDDDAGDDADAPAKTKVPSTPKSKTKATDSTSPNANKLEEWKSLTEAPKGFRFPAKLKADFAKGKYSKEEKWTMFLAFVKQQRKTERAKKRKAEAEAAAKEKASEEDQNDEDSHEKSSSKKRKTSSSAKSSAKKVSSKKADTDDMSSDDDFEKKKGASAKKATSGKKRKKSSADEGEGEEGTKPKATKTPKQGKSGPKKGSLEEIMDPNFKIPKALKTKFDACSSAKEKQEILAKHREKVRLAVEKSKQKKKEAAAAASQD